MLWWHVMEMGVWPEPKFGLGEMEPELFRDYLYLCRIQIPSNRNAIDRLVEEIKSGILE